MKTKFPPSFFVISLSVCLVFFSACTEENRIEPPDSLKGLQNVTIYPSDRKPESTLSFEDNGSIGETAGVSLGQIVAVDVDNDGNVYVAEGTSGHNAVFVFGPDGTFAGQIGRDGRGPGEFISIAAMDCYGGRLFVLDRSLLRIQVFSTDSFTHLFTATLDQSQWNQPGEQIFTYPDKIRVLNDSTLLGTFTQATHDIDTRSFYRLDMNGDVISGKILSQDYVRHIQDPNSSRSFYDLLGGVGHADISTGNRIFTAWSQEMTFKVYDPEGTYLYAFHHPFENAPLSREEALSMYDNEAYNNALKHNGIPEQWRAFEHLVMDDQNRLWVSTITGDDDIYDWWVMDHSGKLLATFTWPRNRVIRAVSGDLVYVENNTGEPDIELYQMK